jgi:hypothetical protein
MGAMRGDATKPAGAGAGLAGVIASFAPRWESESYRLSMPVSGCRR